MNKMNSVLGTNISVLESYEQTYESLQVQYFVQRCEISCSSASNTKVEI